MDREFDELASHLRQGAGAELRAEAEEVERLVHQDRLRKRNTEDAFWLHANRGDGVEVFVAGMDLAGYLCEIGSDYAVLLSHSNKYAFRFDGARVRFYRGANPPPDRPASVTFRARLAEAEEQGAFIAVGSDAPEVVDGKIRAVAADHVLIDTSSSETYIPVERIVLLITSGEQFLGPPLTE